MALPLEVRTRSRIKIGDSLLRVLFIAEGGKSLDVEVDGKKFTITPDERTEVLPNVFVFCGVYGDVITQWKRPDGTMSMLHSRLVFEAPFSIKINRLKGRVVA